MGRHPGISAVDLRIVAAASATFALSGTTSARAAECLERIELAAEPVGQRALQRASARTG